MKYAQQILPNGQSRIVDASGQPLGCGDADRPLLHVLPKLFVPVKALGVGSKRSLHPSGLTCDKIILEVTSTLPIDIQPEGGIFVRQPYPNRQYFVGGSALLRNGWLVPLPPDAAEFDVQFSWQCEDAWLVFHVDEWEVRHLIHIKLHPGKGMTYTMDSKCWPQRDGPAMKFTPVTPLGIKGDDKLDQTRRNIIRESNLMYPAGDEWEGDISGYFLEEGVEITGIPLEQAYTIDAFQDEHLHEVKQTAILKQNNDTHRANGSIEMPPDLFVRAVKLVEEHPFDKKSEFAKSVAGVSGGCERHPAMRLLCEWWNEVRPQGEPFRPGLAMPMVRVRDDGEYWWGYYEIPNVAVENFNSNGRDTARVGDFLLILFQATQDAATFDDEGMHIALPSGEPFNCIGIAKRDYLAGESDEAWHCLQALASFPSRFPAAWNFLNQKGWEYVAARRAQVAINLPLPEGMRPCYTCNGMPTLTEDPTDHSDSRFRLECGDHFMSHQASLENVIQHWSFDHDSQPPDDEPDSTAQQ